MQLLLSSSLFVRKHAAMDSATGDVKVDGWIDTSIVLQEYKHLVGIYNYRERRREESWQVRRVAGCFVPALWGEILIRL